MKAAEKAAAAQAAAAAPVKEAAPAKESAPKPAPSPLRGRTEKLTRMRATAPGALGGRIALGEVRRSSAGSKWSEASRAGAG